MSDEPVSRVDFLFCKNLLYSTRNYLLFFNYDLCAVINYFSMLVMLVRTHYKLMLGKINILRRMNCYAKCFTSYFYSNYFKLTLYYWFIFRENTLNNDTLKFRISLAKLKLSSVTNFNKRIYSYILRVAALSAYLNLLFKIYWIFCKDFMYKLRNLIKSLRVPFGKF